MIGHRGSVSIKLSLGVPFLLLLSCLPLTVRCRQPTVMIVFGYIVVYIKTTLILSASRILIYNEVETKTAELPRY